MLFQDDLLVLLLVVCAICNLQSVIPVPSLLIESASIESDDGIIK